MDQGLEIKIFTEAEKTVWNDFINNSHWGDLLQMWEWGETKKIEGWDPVRIGVLKEGKLIVAAQCLIKPANVLGNYIYIPHGPVFQEVTGLKTGIKTLKKALTELAREREGFVIEIEPKIGSLPEELLATPIVSKNLQYLIDPAVLKIFETAGFAVTGRNMQPKYKLFYDLDQSEEQLLALMKKNTRYNVKLAIKKGVQVKEYSLQDPQLEIVLAKFYEMLLLTRERAKGYPIRSLEYFKQFVSIFKDSGKVSFFEASFQGETIAINISERTKSWASSFYASSNRLYPDVKAPYLLRWESICKAKLSGSKLYDFWGIVPDSAQHKGYSENKLSFGGVRMDTYGILALPLSFSRYLIWNRLVPLRSKLFGLFRK